jgi:hypothetical protein
MQGKNSAAYPSPSIFITDAMYVYFVHPCVVHSSTNLLINGPGPCTALRGLSRCPRKDPRLE